MPSLSHVTSLQKDLRTWKRQMCKELFRNTSLKTALSVKSLSLRYAAGYVCRHVRNKLPYSAKHWRWKTLAN